MDSWLFGSAVIFSLTHFLIIGSGATVTTDVTHTSRPGVSVTLKCYFNAINPSGFQITWRKVGQTGGIASLSQCTSNDITTCRLRNIADPGKYAVEGALGTGVNLVIQDLTLEDDGEYECKVVDSNGISKASVRLIVTSPPSIIDLLDSQTGDNVQNKVTYAVIGQRLMLNCSIPTPSNPPPAITWSTGNITIDTSDQVNQLSDEPPLVTSFREVALIAKESDSGKVVTCLASHNGLTTPLQAYTTLEAGNLPGSPSNIAVSKSSITTDSFTVTWLQGSSGGKPQTFTISFCPVDDAAECREQSDIQPTVFTLANLQASTVYQVWVESRTVFGVSVNNERIEVSTRPLPPNDMGVYGVYNSVTGAVDIYSYGNTTGPIPTGLCFLLMFGVTYTTPDDEVPSSACRAVGQSIPIPSGRSWKDATIVGYGNSVYSAPSLVTSEKGPATPSTSTSTTYIAIGVSVGCVVVILLIVAFVCFIKNKSSSSVQSKNSTQTRNLPARPMSLHRGGQGDRQQTGDPERYGAVKYQEVMDPPSHSYDTGMIGEGESNELYAYSERDTRRIQDKTTDVTSGQYYSRNIAPIAKKGSVEQKYGNYGYMDPNQ